MTAPVAKRPRIGEVDLSPAEDQIVAFPDEVLVRIFCFLKGRRDIVSISLTNKRFHLLAQDEEVWQAAVKNDFPMINSDMYTPFASWRGLYRCLFKENVWKWEENSTQPRCLRTFDLPGKSEVTNLHLLRDGTIVVCARFSADASDDETGRLLFFREKRSRLSLDCDCNYESPIFYTTDGSSVAALKGDEGFHCKWGNGHYEVSPFERETVDSDSDTENLPEESRFLVKNLLCGDGERPAPSAGCIAAKYAMEIDTEGRKCLAVHKTVANASLRMEYSQVFEEYPDLKYKHCYCSHKIAFSLCGSADNVVVIWNAETGKLLGEVDIGGYNYNRIVCEVRDGTMLLQQDTGEIESQYVMIDAAYTPPKVRKLPARVDNTWYVHSLSPILATQTYLSWNLLHK